MRKRRARYSKAYLRSLDRKVDRQCAAAADQEWSNMLKETPYMAGDHTKLFTDFNHSAADTAWFATLEEAVAWLRSRGDCGTVRQAGVGLVYTGAVAPPRPPQNED
jgi:hypothetical protein